jgi:ribosomal protein S18 acetylase RimI-like enzyme
MATLTKLLVPSSSSAHLRSFDVRRDLKPVADLVEQCFADTLDPDGERYLRQMRAAANNPGFLRWASLASEWASVPLSGFVWEEDGRLVGNISLIPYVVKGRRYFLIANVAVHPEYRRRGIARGLTARAMDQARLRGAAATWLHVRENNEAAVTLYRSLGFIERARRTTWYSTHEIPAGQVASGFTLAPRQPRYWKAQYAWLKRSYPPELTWHLSLNLNALRPGLPRVFYRLITNTYVHHWAAIRNYRLAGVLTWQATSAYANTLWLAVPPGDEDAVVHALLLYARQNLSSRRALSLDYPAHRASQAIQSTGFYPHQTLIWMSADLPKDR